MVRGVLEALRSEAGRRMVSTVGTYELMLNPVRVNGRRLPVRLQPPRLGEQTEAILQELSGRS
jgi:crotonobetainyl-CoA:carnitine CoA-transferase CaiB-like acyl-CoA transferase